jgi:hypothetical protein
MEQDLKKQARTTLGREDFGMWLLEQGMVDARALYLYWRCSKCGRVILEFETRCITCQTERLIN